MPSVHILGIRHHLHRNPESLTLNHIVAAGNLKCRLTEGAIWIVASRKNQLQNLRDDEQPNEAISDDNS